MKDSDKIADIIWYIKGMIANDKYLECDFDKDHISALILAQNLLIEKQSKEEK